MLEQERVTGHVEVFSAALSETVAEYYPRYSQLAESHPIVVDEELVHKTGRFSAAGRLEVTIYPVHDAPDEGQTMSVVINDDRIFTGTLSDVNEQENGTVRLIAHDALYALKQATLTRDFDGVGIGEIARAAGNQADQTVVVDTDTEQDAAAAQVERQVAPLEEVSGLEIDVSDAVDAGLGKLYPSFTNTRCDRVIERCARWASGSYWVDERNIVHIGPSPSSLIELTRLLANDASQAPKPYQSVKVIGTSPADKAGLEDSHLLPDERVTATAGSGEPQYTYRSEQIWTPYQAETVAQKVYREIRRKQRGGTIEIVGRADVRPLDIVQLPSETAYMVDKLTHRLSTDGFVTSITCSAPIIAE